MTDRDERRFVAEEVVQVLNRLAALRHEPDERAVFVVSHDDDGTPIVVGTRACRRGQFHVKSWTVPRAANLARRLVRCPVHPHRCGRDFA